MGLNLARLLKAEAELAESFAVRGTDPAAPARAGDLGPELYRAARGLRTPARFRREAESILERVKAEYGDVKYLNGMVLTEETLATVADRELADVRTLAIGQAAPEIVGQDVDGKPMELSEFRGKVVVLDFGSHTHCGACRLAYPRLRALVDRTATGRSSSSGSTTMIARGPQGARGQGELTWRSWWDGGQPDGPGPITTGWNIRGYPTFIVLDHGWDDPLQGPPPARRPRIRQGDRNPGQGRRGRHPATLTGWKPIGRASRPGRASLRRAGIYI